MFNVILCPLCTYSNNIQMLLLMFFLWHTRNNFHITDSNIKCTKIGKKGIGVADGEMKQKY